MSMTKREIEEQPEMARRTRLAMVAVAVGVAITSAPTAARAEPPPADVQKLLDQMAGSWSVKAATLQVDGKSITSDSQAVCEKVAGGWALRCKVTVTAGAHRDEMIQVLSWDRPGRAFHLYSVNSSGDRHDHTGSFDGKTLPV